VIYSPVLTLPTLITSTANIDFTHNDEMT